VDLDRGIIRIVESLEQTKKGLRFKSPNTHRARAISLPSFAVEELRRLKREQAERLLTLGIRQTGATLLCARADGKPLQPQSLTLEFPRFLARLGSDFPRVRFHDLRHTLATQLVLAGVHPKIAQERLGHSSIYHHPRPLQPCHGDDARGCCGPYRRRFPGCYKARARMLIAARWQFRWQRPFAGFGGRDQSLSTK
jgi:integrase